MKKIGIVGLFIAGIIVGALGLNILSIRASSNNQGPLISTSLDMKSLIENISQSMRNKNLTLTKDRYSRFEEVFKVLEGSYFYQDKIQSDVMIKKAIKALVNALDDPYTEYMDHEEYAGFQEELKGTANFEGIGAVVTKKDYYVMIEEVIKQSPAFNAGLKPLDRIIAIDGKSTKDETISEAVKRIRGPKGSKVIVTIERANHKDNIKNDTPEVMDVEVIRDTLTVPSLTNDIITLNDKNKIAHITISMIGEETENLLKKELLAIQKDGVKGVILDLRGNGGGILPIAVEIASHFIPKNKIVVTAKYQSFPTEIYTSQGYGNFEGKPIVVLIDGMTASAGEIIAMALQEQIGATLIGTQTFGKGSIQTLFDFPDQDSLKYTIGRRYAPSEKNIDKIGVTPDITVEFNADQFTEKRIDNQLEEAKRVMSTKIK